MPGGIRPLADASPLIVTVLFFAFLRIYEGGVDALSFLAASAMIAPSPVSATARRSCGQGGSLWNRAHSRLRHRHGPDAGAGLWLILAGIAGFTMIVALRHHPDNLKRRLAYSTISQLSYIILGAAC